MRWFNRLERVRGIEPPTPPWQGGVLPLNYTRDYVYSRLYDRVRKIRIKKTLKGLS